MKRKAKTKRKTARGGTLLVICAVALFVLLRLLRMQSRMWRTRGIIFDAALARRRVEEQAS